MKFSSLFSVNRQKDLALLFLRLMLATVIFPHGAQKLLGSFDGYGYAGTMRFFTDTMHLPWLIGFLVIQIEFFGPFFILLGFATRIWGAALTCVMMGIILTTFPNHFFMDWFGNQKSEGAEYFLLAIGISVALTLAGGGRLSLDAPMSRARLNWRNWKV